jgi:hypothetical protein
MQNKSPLKELSGLQVIWLTLHVLETLAAAIGFGDDSLSAVLHFTSRCLYRTAMAALVMRHQVNLCWCPLP